MIQHIVAFRLSGADTEEKRRQSSLAEAELRKLDSGQIPGLIDLRVRPDLGKVATHWDLVLISHHESEAALENYMAHPLHVDVAQKVALHVADKVIIDSQI